MPAASRSAISTGANRAKRTNASPRSAGAVRKTASSIMSPPAHRDADERCTQSASSDHFDVGGSNAE